MGFGDGLFALLYDYLGRARKEGTLTGPAARRLELLGANVLEIPATVKGVWDDYSRVLEYPFLDREQYLTRVDVLQQADSGLEKLAKPVPEQVLYLREVAHCFMDYARHMVKPREKYIRDKQFASFEQQVRKFIPESQELRALVVRTAYMNLLRCDPELLSAHVVPETNCWYALLDNKPAVAKLREKARKRFKTVA